MKDSTQGGIGALLAHTLAEVVEIAAGFSLEIIEDSRDAPLKDRTGVMSFTGNKRGMVFVSITDNDMKILCSHITGVSPDEVESDDCDDSLCEIINMLSGSAKLQLPDNDFIFMVPWPYVIKGTKVAVSPKNKVPAASWLLQGTVTVGIKIIFDPGNTVKKEY